MSPAAVNPSPLATRRLTTVADRDGINLDTEWHKNQKGYLDSPSGANWYSGVFDWDTSLYPSPAGMMDWLERRGLWPAWMGAPPPPPPPPLRLSSLPPGFVATNSC